MRTARMTRVTSTSDRDNCSSGFAAIDLAIVVAVLVVVSAVLSAATRGAREEAHKTTCARNLALLGCAVQLYANDHEGHGPRSVPYNALPFSDVSLPLLFDDYVAQPRVLICPATGDRAAPMQPGVRLARGQCSYAYDSLKVMPKVRPLVAVAADRPLGSDTDLNSRNHGGRGQNVVYRDGHVEWHTTPFAGIAGDDGKRDHIWRTYATAAGRRVAHRARDDSWIASSPKPRFDTRNSCLDGVEA